MAGEPQDCSAALQDAVRDAHARRRPLALQGSGSKAFLGLPVDGEPLSLAENRGILHHEPSELVVTARAGTRLHEIEQVLDVQGQMLAFEPPHFGDGATLGGTIACGLAGPRRPFAGAVRDFVLGVRILNGRGEMLRFGGEVMKNVAGFDVSRLMVGAFGTLGVLLEISVKVLPRPEMEATVHVAMTAAQAVEAMNGYAGGPLPFSAMAWCDGILHLRLSGAESAVAAACRSLGGDANFALPFPPGDVKRSGESFWTQLREQRLPFFRQAGDLWRLSLAPAAPPLSLPGDWLYDWGGAQRWLKTDVRHTEVFEAAAALGGHATLFRPQASSDNVFQPLPPALLVLHRRLKQAFDPAGILNPGRLYPDL